MFQRTNSVFLSHQTSISISVNQISAKGNGWKILGVSNLCSIVCSRKLPKQINLTCAYWKITIVYFIFMLLLVARTDRGTRGVFGGWPGGWLAPLSCSAPCLEAMGRVGARLPRSKKELSAWLPGNGHPHRFFRVWLSESPMFGVGN
jgi:hypothetical protein